MTVSEISKCSSEKKPQRNQNVVKHRQDRSRPIDQLESKGNIYQHASQSIEGNEDCLASKLASDLRAHDLHAANREGSQSCSYPSSAERTPGVTPSTFETLSKLVSTPWLFLSR